MPPRAQSRGYSNQIINKIRSRLALQGAFNENIFHFNQCSTRPIKDTNNYFTGISFKISTTNFQNFWVEEIQALSSGECAPLMVGPKEIISIPG